MCTVHFAYSLQADAVPQKSKSRDHNSVQDLTKKSAVSIDSSEAEKQDHP